MRTLEEIVSAYHARRRDMNKPHAIGAQIRAIYDGDTHIALPEIEATERPAVANLLQTGLDAHAQRIASVLPVPSFTPTRTGQAAVQAASDRRNAISGWWAANRINLLMRHRARDLIGLTMAPVCIRPSRDGIPRWHLRDPLLTYPAPGLNPEEIVPPDVIFTFRRSLRELQAMFDLTGLQTGPNPPPDLLFDCLEYMDADQHSIIILGRGEPGQPYLQPGTSSIAGGGDIIAAQTPNRAGRPLAIIPGRITLGRLQGQFDQTIGMYLAAAKLWGLHLHGVSRAIFGETWLEATQPGVIPQIIAEADPIAGQTGIVDGGRLQQFRPDPGFQTLPALDRLERGQRLNGQVPAEFGGESSSNVRTGRRGGQILSAAVDMPVQEHQEILAASLEEENRAAIALAKAYYGTMTVSFNVPGQRKKLSYQAGRLFSEGEDHTVSYAYAGTDTNGLVIEAGQRIAMETLSHERFMEIDPLVQDVDLERDRILIESIQKAHLTAIQTQAADPNGPYQPGDLGRLTQLIIEQNMPLYQAEQALNDEIKTRQAKAAQGQLTPEQMQPGMAQPGAPGTLENAAPVEGPQPGQQHLLQLLGSLRLPQRSSPAEQNFQPPAGATLAPR